MLIKYTISSYPDCIVDPLSHEPLPWVPFFVYTMASNKSKVPPNSNEDNVSKNAAPAPTVPSHGTTVVNNYHFNVVAANPNLLNTYSGNTGFTSPFHPLTFFNSGLMNHGFLPSYFGNHFAFPNVLNYSPMTSTMNPCLPSINNEQFLQISPSTSIEPAISSLRSGSSTSNLPSQNLMDLPVVPRIICGDSKLSSNNEVFINTEFPKSLDWFQSLSFPIKPVSASLQCAKLFSKGWMDVQFRSLFVKGSSDDRGFLHYRCCH